MYKNVLTHPQHNVMVDYVTINILITNAANS